MDITIFLAQIWGPVLLALGLGIFFSRKHYIKLYRDLEKETMAVFVFSVAAIAAGIAQIGAHNIWGSLPEVLISLFGWILLVKGVIFAIRPQYAEGAGNWWSDRSGLFTATASLVLIIGAYLTWFGFLM